MFEPGPPNLQIWIDAEAGQGVVFKQYIGNVKQKHEKALVSHLKRLAGRKMSPLNFLFSTTQALLDIYNQMPFCRGGSPSCIDVKTAGVQAFRHRLVPCSACFYFHGLGREGKAGENGRDQKHWPLLRLSQSGTPFPNCPTSTSVSMLRAGVHLQPSNLDLIHFSVSHSE